MRRRAWLAGVAGLGMGLVLQSEIVWASSASSPVGHWRTIDDKTNKPSGAVEIYAQGGALFGRVIGIADPKMQTALCHDCGGYAQNRPVMGLVVLQNMRADGAQWDGGTILNPASGAVYHCRMRLSGDGQTLTMRGYIGTPLLGRTQIWQRLPE